jgi:hypothetical protein
VLAWSGSNVFMQVSGLFGVRLRGGQSRLVPLCSRWVVRSCVRTRRRRRHDPCLPDELSRRGQRPRLRGLGTPPKPSGKRGTLRSVRGKTSLIISPGAHSHGNTRVSHQVTGYVVLTPWSLGACRRMIGTSRQGALAAGHQDISGHRHALSGRSGRGHRAPGRSAPRNPLSPFPRAWLYVTTQPLVLQLLTSPPPTPLALPAQLGLPYESAPRDG